MLTGAVDPQRLTTLRELLACSPDEFEECCARLLERAGYGQTRVTRKGPKGGDGGIDLTMTAQDGRVIACGQCKRWSYRPASGLMRPIRELSGSMTDLGIPRGFFIITTSVTGFERNKARRLNIEVIDADDLESLLVPTPAPPTDAPATDANGVHRAVVGGTAQGRLSLAAKIILDCLLVVVAIAFFKVLLPWILLILLLAAAGLSGSGRGRRYPSRSRRWRPYRPHRRRAWHGYRY